MKTLFKTINLFLLGIFIMPSFLLLFCNNNKNLSYIGYYSDNNYFETGTSTYSDFYIEYDSYTMTEVLMQRSVPLYNNVTQLNSCAPMAATIVLGFYDLDFPNLIPNAEVGRWYNGKYYYSGTSTQVINIKEHIYDLMGTNTEAPGTSVNQFKTGFRAYVLEQDYNIQFNSCGALNFNSLSNYLNNQQPIVVFFNSYRFFIDGVISDDGTKLTFYERSSNNGHVAVCYGYREYTFTKNNNTWTERYLIVSFGNGSSGLMDVTSLSRVDESYAVSIY